MPKGVCSQAGVAYTDCELAKKREVQETTEEKFVCSECGEQLERQSDQSTSPPYMKYAVASLILAGLAGGAYFARPMLQDIWSGRGGNNVTPPSEPVKQQPVVEVTPPPAPKVAPACEVQLHQFVSIPARQAVRLVPDGEGTTTTDRQRRYNTFRNWLEDKRVETAFSADAFYILRFEVSIEAFKAYFDLLAENERSNLHKSLQKLVREGDPAMPVGYITPEVAQAYADWLKPSFAECFADGFKVSVPSEQQWMSALYDGLDHTQDKATLATQQPTGYQAADEGIVYHLLANQREWLRDGDCPTGKSLRTQYSYKTGAEYVANFMPALSCAWADSTIPRAEDGFRVVIEGKRAALR